MGATLVTRTLKRVALPMPPVPIAEENSEASLGTPTAGVATGLLQSRPGNGRLIEQDSESQWPSH